ncbi:unnamed protein product [Meloidogyne enterolobii]|uniref:Uncharacterized protein n=1 Tax=Meloidogyne enterolobii TaxID=390850 RepID=A0ACB0ZN79_MELEN
MSTMLLDELNQTIPGPTGFDNLERSYSSAVYCARGISGCTQALSVLVPIGKQNLFLFLSLQIKNKFYSKNRFVGRRVICCSVCAIWIISTAVGTAQIAFGATNGLEIYSVIFNGDYFGEINETDKFR